LDPVLVIAVALAGGACLALQPWPTLAATAMVGWLLKERVRHAVRWLFIALLAVSGARATTALAHAAALHAETRDSLSPPARCEIVGEVMRSPVVLGTRSGHASVGLGRARIDVDVHEGECDGRILTPRRVRLYQAPDDSSRGDRLWLVVDVAPVHAFDNPGLPDPRIALALSGATGSGTIVDAALITSGFGVRSWIDRLRARVRRRIELTFPPDTAPLARALVLGETDLGASDREAFRASGLAHLLAVSGTHLVLVVLTFGRFLTAVLLRLAVLADRIDVARISAALCLPVTWLYAELAGGGGSAWRAAIMLAFGLAARVAGRRADALRCFAFSLATGSLYEPLAICDASFALSLGATAGLLMFAARCRALASTGTLLAKLASTMLATAAAMIGCAPVLLFLSPCLPLVGVAANVLAAPVGEVAALPLCLVHAIAWWSSSAELGAAVVATGALRLVRAIAHAAATAPLVSLAPPTPWQVAIVTIVCSSLIRWPSRTCRVAMLGALALLVAEGQARRVGAPLHAVRITALDVGQGDSLLVDLPDGRLMMIDGGGMPGSGIDLGRRVLLPELAARRRARVDVLVISHPHPDHYLGLLGAVPELDIGEVWDSGLGERLEPDGELAKMLAALRGRGVAIITPSSLCRSPRQFGAATVRVLAPCPDFDPSASENDNSLVIRIELGARAALLTGDAERATETELARRFGVRLRADLLKVGHHGSKTSTTRPFLQLVEPRHALLSAGVRNRFGHPHPATLAVLADHRVKVMRTDRDGAVTWWTDGHRMRTWRAGDARRALLEIRGLPSGASE
jgi:competence protein ComEC